MTEAMALEAPGGLRAADSEPAASTSNPDAS